MRIAYSSDQGYTEGYQEVTVDIILQASDLEEALFRAENILEQKLGLLTFHTMSPPIRVYKDIVHEELNQNADDVEALQPTSPIAEYSAHFEQKLVLNNLELLFNHPDEKITDSMRWFRKGLLDRIKVDSFIALWIALEMIASKLKPAGKKFLKCPRCTATIETCPHCEGSTEMKPMEKDGIMHHITHNLGITNLDYYKKLNNMRNDVFHGRGSKVKSKHLSQEIEKLKYCLLTAYYILIYGELPDQNDPVYIRYRLTGIGMPFLKMKVHGKSLKENQDKINYVPLIK